MHFTTILSSSKTDHILALEHWCKCSQTKMKDTVTEQMACETGFERYWLTIL